ncbi:unnamed protein product, partial [Polarella glacialis]
AVPEPEVCSLEAVQAWRGVEEGMIYPLRGGLCFLPRPATFIPAEDILSAEAGKGGGPRGGDLVVHRVDKALPDTFSNVSRADIPNLLAYLSKLVALRAPGDGEADDDEDADDPDFEDEDDEDDENDEDAEDDEDDEVQAGTSSRGRVTRSKVTRSGGKASAATASDAPAPKRSRRGAGRSELLDDAVVEELMLQSEDPANQDEDEDEDLEEEEEEPEDGDLEEDM